MPSPDRMIALDTVRMAPPPLSRSYQHIIRAPLPLKRPKSSAARASTPTPVPVPVPVAAASASPSSSLHIQPTGPQRVDGSASPIARSPPPSPSTSSSSRSLNAPTLEEQADAFIREMEGGETGDNDAANPHGNRSGSGDDHEFGSHPGTKSDIGLISNLSSKSEPKVSTTISMIRDTRTEAEKKFERAQFELEKRRKKRKESRSGNHQDLIDMSYRERIEAYNRKLAKLSEHHDMPKIGPG